MSYKLLAVPPVPLSISTDLSENFHLMWPIQGTGCFKELVRIAVF